MRKIIIAAAMACLALTTSACGQRIRFDEAAVEVIEVGSNSGVQETEIPTGRYFAPPFSYRYIVKFPTTQQTYKWDAERAPSFINADRVQTNLAVSANIRINPADADNIVRKYKGAISKDGGQDGYVLDDVVTGPISREIRQAFIEEGVNFTSAQLFADGGRALLDKVKARVAPKFEKDGIIIADLLSSSPPQLPSDIVASIRGGLRATEDAKRKTAELLAVEAEGKKTVAQARADADARELTAASIRANPEILKYEEIKARGKSLCPTGVSVCNIGASAPAIVGALGN